MTQWFYIYSAAADADNPLVLNVWGQSTSQNTHTIVWGVETQPSQRLNELWCFTSDGYILSALGSQNMVLGVDNGNAVIQARSSNDPSQQWTVLAGPSAPGKTGTNLALIQNNQSQQLLTVSGSGTPQPDQAVITSQSQPGNPASQCWAIVPCLPATGQSVLIATSLSSWESPLLLNVRGASLEPGADAIIWPPGANADNEVWQFTVEGYIVSGLNSELVLSLGPNGSVVTYPMQPNLQPFQLWSMTADGAIVNQQNGQALTVSGGTATQDATVVTQALSGNKPSTAQQWKLYPGFPLDVILAQPPVPFPAFTGDEATAYSYINQTLELTNDGGLRGQYANLDAPLSSYQTDIAIMTPDPAVSSADWNAVVDQLNTELTDAIAIRAMFAQMTAFYNLLSTTKSMELSAIASTVGVPSNSTIKGVIGTVFEGLLYTALSAAGTGCSVVANLMETAVNGVEKAQDGSNTLGSFTGTLAKLETQLGSAVVAVNQMLGQQETVILQDWWKMQQVYALTKLPIKDPDSLAWPAKLSGELLDALIPGYQVSVLQMLLPTLYKICRWAQIPGNYGPPSTKAPSYAKWSESVAGGVTNYYEVSQSGESGYPSSAIMDMIWNNGVRPANFYRRSNGWQQLDTADMGWIPPTQASPHLCNMLLITVVNRTSSALEVKVTGGNYNGLSWSYFAGSGHSSGSATMPVYGALSVALWTNVNWMNSISAKLTIVSGKSTVLTINASQAFCSVSAGGVSVSPSSGNGSDSYSFTSSTVAGSYGADDWGYAEIEVWQYL